MKKELVILMLMFSIAACSAVSLEIENPNMQPEETFLAKLTGDFVNPISKSDIEFYEGDRRTYHEYDITFYNGTYYIYAYFLREGNFTIKINNILYKAPDLKSKDIEETIEVRERPLENNKTKILSIKPGFVFTSGSAEITLSNRGTDSLDLGYNSINTNLIPENYEKVIFTPQSEFSYFTVESYSTFTIPVIYFSLENPSQNQTNESFSGDLKPSLDKIVTKIILKSAKVQKLILENTANTTMKDMIFESDISFLKLPKLSEIPAGESEEIELEFSPEDTGVFKASFIINYTLNSEKRSLKIPLEVYVFPEDTPINQTNITEETCAERGGTICNSSKNEECTGSRVFAEDGWCCLTECEPGSSGNGEESGNSIYWGLLIFVLIALAGFIIYKKYKKTTSQSPQQKIQQTEDSYKQRISGGLSRT